MLKLENNFSITQVTTLGIGGPAKKFVSVTSAEELIEAIQYATQNHLEYLVIGSGSNLLVSDQGFAGLIIKNQIAKITITSLKTTKPTFKLKVKSGTILQDLVDYSIKKGLSGLQKLNGIPGTVGGAVFGNAGAYGQTISDHIIKVTTLDPSTVIPAGECDFNYRDSTFKRNKQIILEVTFQLEKGDPKILQQQADEVLKKRLVKYPPGIKCPGSFFKNLLADKLPKQVLSKIPKQKIVYGKLPAGALLEMVGAKGDQLDNIKIADYHANLFINTGEGRASSFYQLAQKYALKVYDKFGIKLEPEVQLINLPKLL